MINRAEAPPVGGSNELAAARAAAALLGAGVSNLGAKLGAYVAAFGDLVCFQRYEALQRAVLRPDGKRYHLESIGRAFRRLVAAGFCGLKRVRPGQLPTGAKYYSPHGTTEKWLIWKTLGLKCPVSAADRKAIKAAQLANERAHQAIAAEHQPRPTKAGDSAAPVHSTPVQSSTPPTSEVERAQGMIERLAARVFSRMDAREDAAAVAAAGRSKRVADILAEALDGGSKPPE